MPDGFWKRIFERTKSSFLARGIFGFYTKFLTPKSLHEDDSRREFILNIILVFLIGLMAILEGVVVSNSWRLGNSYNGVSLIWFSAFTSVFLGLYALSRKGFFRLASFLMIGSCFAITTYSAYAWGIDLPSAILGFALTGVIASILISTRFGLFVTGIIILTLILFGYREVTFTSFPDHFWRQQLVEANDILEYSLILLLIATVSWLSNREIEKSLTRARRSEEELQRQNAALEMRVDERTKILQQTQAEQISELYRFAEFGRLASGLFHDLINMITALSVRVEHTAARPHATKTDVKQAIAVSRRAEQYMQAIRKQLQYKTAPEVFSLSESIEDAFRLLSYRARKANIKLQQSGDALNYYGDPLMLHQIIMNLLSSAIDSFETIGDNRERYITIGASRNQETAVLTVSDNGSGITSEYTDKIFEPFFTTKESKKSIGIGLTTVKRIVGEELKGTITLDTARGKGTTFQISFPIVKQV